MRWISDLVHRVRRIEPERAPSAYFGSREEEPAWHDADHRHQLSIEHDLMSNDARRTTEILSPDGVTDDDHGWCARPVVVRVEYPAQRRMHAEHVEQRWGAQHEWQHSGARCAGAGRVRSGIGGEDRDLVENAEPFAKKVVLFAAPRVVHPEDVNASRVAIGQATKH